MKIIALLVSAGLVFSAAGQSTSQDPPSAGDKKPERKVNPAPPPITIPKDATPLGDGSFRYVDKDGKKWIYRNSPFGVEKAEERPTDPVTRRVAVDPVKCEDLGDTVRFTQLTPFGPEVWIKKKTELDSREKSIWDRDHQKTGSQDQPDASKRDGKASSSGDAKSSGPAKQD